MRRRYSRGWPVTSVWKSSSMSSLVSVGCEGVDRCPLAGMYKGRLLLWSDFKIYDDGDVFTTGDAMSWYMVLWSEGWLGSCTRPAPQALTAPDRKVMRTDFCFAMPCRVRIRYVRS